MNIRGVNKTDKHSAPSVPDRPVSRGVTPTNKRSWMQYGADIVFLLGASALGFYISGINFEAVVPIILSLTGFIIMRFALRRPFYEAFTLYLAIAAFNYYYFYCSAYTGRNPTDVEGSLGLPATNLEKMQKDIVFGLVLLLAGMKLFSRRLQGGEVWAKKTSNPIIRMILMLAAYSTLRSFFVIFEGDSIFNAMYYLRVNVEYALVPFLLLTSLFLKEKHLKIIFHGILYTLPLVAILGIIEFFIHGSPYEKSFYGGQIFSRATSTLQNPNNLGGYLATALGIYILYYFKNQLSRYEKWLFWPTMPIGLICLFMTVSRSSILAFFLAMTACMVIMLMAAKKDLEKDRYKFYRKLITGYVLVGGISFIILWKYFDLASAAMDAVELYFQESLVRDARVFALLPTLKVMLSNPFGTLFGYSKTSLLGAPDNAFASVLVRSGVVGFLMYVSIWIMGFKYCLKRILDPVKQHSFLYLICFYVLTFQAIYGFSASINQNFPHNLYFWFTIGVIIWMETPFIKKEYEEADIVQPHTSSLGLIPKVAPLSTSINQRPVVTPPTDTPANTTNE